MVVVGSSINSLGKFSSLPNIRMHTSKPKKKKKAASQRQNKTAACASGSGTARQSRKEEVVERNGALVVYECSTEEEPRI